MVHGVVESWTEVNSTIVKTTVTTKKKTVLKNVRENKGAGSRRIFSPTFKLQVLDSYRNDSDCQGNQRATARKFGIHRRQIQKWLQMEKSLRLSVQQSTALNLTSARQPDGNKDCNASTVSVIQVKKSSSVSSVTSFDKLSNFDNNFKEYNASDSEEYVNVDKLSDSEDDTSSCSSYEKSDKALDLTRATLSKRRFYTIDFKIHVLDAFKNDNTCKGNLEETAKKFGINRRQLQKWLNQESLLKSEQALNNSCLDLSQNKRKLQDLQVREVDTKRRIVEYEQCTDIREQDTALCLVKNKIEPAAYHRTQLYPLSIEHSLHNSLTYVNPEYPLCHLYQPWNCCYQQFTSVSSFTGFVPPKYSHPFDVKVSNYRYESSYVDIPVQCGFGDNVPSKWFEENPLYLHEPRTVQVISSYR